MAFVVQHSSELKDLQVLGPGVLDGGKDLDVGRGRDLVGWSREVDLKTTSGVSGGLGVGTDGCKTESNEIQRKHDDTRRSRGSLFEV